MSASVPSSLALTNIADGASIIASDHRNNYSSVQTAVNALVAVLALATAKGDLVVATASGTFDHVAVGANSKALVADSTQPVGMGWAYPPGYEFAYNEVTTDQTSTATSTATATAVATASAVTFDGSTAVWIEFFCANWELTVTNQNMILSLYDGATELGVLDTIRGGPVATQENGAIRVARRLTPSAAAHTYSVKASVSAAATATFKAGAGTIGVYMPAFIRITKA